MAGTPDGDREVERMADRVTRALAKDSDFAEAFARTPGKVVQELGIPASAVPSLLASMAGPPATPAKAGRVPGISNAIEADIDLENAAPPSPRPSAEHP